MVNEYVKTPSELADEARQAGRDAMSAVQGQAAEALDTAEGVAADAKDVAQDATAAGKAYARGAVEAASEKLGVLQDKVAAAQESCTRYIAQQPVKATMMAVAGGALLTGLLMAAVRGRRG